MQNELYLNAVTQDFLDDFLTEYFVELFGKETDEAEDVETRCNLRMLGADHLLVNR